MSKTLATAATALLIALSSPVALADQHKGHHQAGPPAGAGQHCQNAGPGAMQGGMMQGDGMMQGKGMMQGTTACPQATHPHHMSGPMMRMMMAMIDTDANGTLSLEEVLAVHRRLFAYADTDGDGELTPEEIRLFMTGKTTAQ